MKTNNVLKQLSRFRTSQDKNGHYIFSSRCESHRFVRVILQGENEAVALPINRQYDGADNVAFHATTIKSLVEFLEGK